uniref:Putative ovule protein n=1 Tax=Solanum chacoense TaxID=4108 RepID=A0A0V0GTA6_SOLCH
MHFSLQSKQEEKNVQNIRLPEQGYTQNMPCPTITVKWKRKFYIQRMTLTCNFNNLICNSQTTENKANVTNSTQKLTNARGNDMQ